MAQSKLQARIEELEREMTFLKRIESELEHSDPRQRSIEIGNEIAFMGKLVEELKSLDVADAVVEAVASYQGKKRGRKPNAERAKRGRPRAVKPSAEAVAQPHGGDTNLGFEDGQQKPF